MSNEMARNRLSQLYHFFKALEDRRTPCVSNINKHRWMMFINSLPGIQI